MEEPSREITLAGESFEINRKNGIVFTFLGELAMYDHVFLISNHDDETGQSSGTYVFKPSEGYPELFRWMMKNQFTAHINLPQVSPSDQEAFERYYYKDVRTAETVPLEWLDGAN